jgi:hypothetical protein
MPDDITDLVKVDPAQILELLDQQGIVIPSGTELSIQVEGLGASDSGTVVVP